ncbi:MAG: Hsp33 family molecular chaperone HslO [Solobacterium sp.]|jgi:molecular chaperone Hsp33|nr:Hsp33 family molecular chaperone HslO [Solobacterium sp.]MCH4206496.1 Hsp33 family molecular chaperone HslO [Solobacterium sp.]MCH4282805.1 Hsp33 family molecular chaperone HslO [Solobacterium sp.]
MKDGIVIAEAMHGEVRIHAACTTQLVEEARIHHTAMPTSIAALGRVMTVTAIMASDLKNKKEKVQAVFNGKGPIGTVLAQADGSGNVKGFAANPNVYLVRKDGHLAVGEGIGTDGTLTVTRDMGLKEPFTSTVALQSGEVGDDFAYYYALSEQVPSVVGVGVLVNPQGKVQAAGGLIYQLMPKASEETIEFCEAAAKAQRPVSELIDKGTDLEEVIRTYFPDANVLAHRDVRFYCGCSKEKFMDSLSALHEKDLQEMIDDGKGAEIVCQYCSTKYNFSTEELKEILEKKHRVEDR